MAVLLENNGQGFEGNCEILRTIIQPRESSFSVLASQKGFIYFVTLWVMFIMLMFYHGKEKTASNGHSITSDQEIQLY